MLDCVATLRGQWKKAGRAITLTALRVGLLGVLRTFDETQLLALSKHFAGRAFDVRAMLEACISTDAGAIETPKGFVRFNKMGAEIVMWLRARAVAYGGKFLTKEGGRIVLHWQC